MGEAGCCQRAQRRPASTAQQWGEFPWDPTPGRMEHGATTRFFRFGFHPGKPKLFCSVGVGSFLQLSVAPHREEKERLREREGKL